MKYSMPYLSPLLILLPLLWSELSVGERYQLTEKITLGEKGPSFTGGTVLALKELEPLAIPGAPVLLLKLEQSPCVEPEWSSELEIITPKGNAESSAVGVQLYKGCQWEVFLEEKDLLTSSFFGPAF